MAGTFPPRRGVARAEMGDDLYMHVAPEPSSGLDDTLRTYQQGAFHAVDLLGAKDRLTISVCIPARDEGRTVAEVITAVALPHLASHGGDGLVDEILVVDDGSVDDTAARAASAGATVLSLSGAGGKGQAMAAGLEATSGDIVIYLDADVTNTTGSFVTSLLGPLLTEPDITLVKGFYQRPLDGELGQGGRVTELMARPLIDALFPQLSPIRQPLAGETAAHRWALEKVGLADNYGVELGLLIDIARRFGISSIAQVDLGTRIHRNRPLSELRPQASDVLRAALDRADPYAPR
jgi:glucosyl-3-phosphoglycerate synthase